jgi:hypothetical protein
MKSGRIYIGVLVIAAFSFGVTGCNVFQGALLSSAAAKIADGNLMALSVDEIMALNQAVVDALPNQPVPKLTTQQAQAMIEFFNANGFNSLAAIQAFATAAQSNPAIIQGAPGLASAFATPPERFNPNAPTLPAVQEICDSILAGGVVAAPPQELHRNDRFDDHGNDAFDDHNHDGVDDSPNDSSSDSASGSSSGN